MLAAEKKEVRAFFMNSSLSSSKLSMVIPKAHLAMTSMVKLLNILNSEKGGWFCFYDIFEWNHILKNVTS